MSTTQSKDVIVIQKRPSTGVAERAWLQFRATPRESRLRRFVNLSVLAGVTIAAIALAVFAYGQFSASSRLLWGSLVHDRNAHYLLGLSLAQDIQQGNIGQLWNDLDGARTWPPLHGILVALVLLVGGLQYQLAVLPSLVGWIGTVIFGFLTARRLSGHYGNLAGLVAVVFILASPAHHVYATDVMLESMGACFSLAALYCYLVVAQENKVWAQRAVGIALTCLFFLKYNYWSLVFAALVGAEIAARPSDFLSYIRGMLASVDWRRWWRAQLRHPLTYVLGLLIAILCILLGGGGGTIELLGLRVSLQSTHNILHLIYVIVCVRIVYGLIRTDRQAFNMNGLYRRILLWHGLPVALWFLWPKRLGYWLWYLFANGGENPQHGLAGSLSFYTESAVNDYHIGVYSAVVAAVLAGIAILTWRRMRPGALAVVLFVVIATAATIPHPNRKSRFLHTWIAAGWVLAGAGFANLLPRRAPSSVRRVEPTLALATVGIVALLHAPAFLSAGDSPERGHNDYLPASTRDLTDYYLDATADSKRIAIFSTMEIKHLLRWSYLERRGDRKNLEIDWKGFGASADDNRARFDEWLRQTSCDTVVHVEVPPGTYLYEITNHNDVFAAQLPELLAAQNVFRLTNRRAFSLYGCTVSIYRRATGQFVNATPRRERQ